MLKISRAPGVPLSDLFRLALLAMPVLALVLLPRNPALDPQFEIPGFHFAIVTFTSLCGICLAALVLRTADRLREPRMFFLGLSFLAVAGFFFAHGLLTPGVIIRFFSTGIGWAPLVGLALGAIFLALSSERLRAARQSRWFAARGWILLGLLLLWAGFLALSLTVPELLEGHPTSLSAYMTPAPASGPMMEEYGPPTAAGEPMYFPWISVTILSISMGLYLLTAWRYARNYRLTRMPLHATVVAGVIMLAESQLSFFLASTWRISWWEYHALVLLGFTTILYGLLTGYRPGAGPTQTGEAMGLSPETLRALYQAGLLHDVGKIGIPDAILNKPGRLTPSEFELVKTHPMLSEDIVGRIPSLRPTLEAIRWHHERLDGSGYPDRLRGDQVPLEARIMAVADVYDAMTSGRSYRSAWPEGAVLTYLRQEAGRLFDEHCVTALHRALSRRGQPPS